MSESNLQSESLVIDPITKDYSRGMSTKSKAVIDAFSKFHNNFPVNLFPSGMASISATMTVLIRSMLAEPSGQFSNFKEIRKFPSKRGEGTVFIRSLPKPIKLVYSNQLYTDTPKVFKTLKELYPDFLELIEFKLSEQESLKDLVKDANCILFTESFSNPDSIPFNFELLKDIKSNAKTLKVVIDNTWMTHIGFQPFNYSEVDVVVYSLSKYYSGGQVIMGASVYRDSSDHLNSINYSIFLGNHISDHDLGILLKRLNDLHERINKSSPLTQQLLFYHQRNLDRFKILKKANFAKLVDHKIYLTPSVINFPLNGISNNKIRKLVYKQTSFDPITSYGGHASRICPYSKNGIRLAIGYSDTLEHLISGLHELDNLLAVDFKCSA